MPTVSPTSPSSRLYLHAITKNHAFVDGNKRTAVATTELFLIVNGYRFTVSDSELISAAERIAKSELDEPAIADWIRGHLAPRWRR